MQRCAARVATRGRYSSTHLLRNFESCVAEIVDVQPQIDARALGAAMAKQIADCLERRTLPKQMNSEGVPQAVRSLVWNRESCPASPRLKSLRYGGRCDGSGGCPDAKKHFSVRKIGTIAFEVLDDRGADLLRER